MCRGMGGEEGRGFFILEKVLTPCFNIDLILHVNKNICETSHK